MAASENIPNHEPRNIQDAAIDLQGAYAALDMIVDTCLQRKQADGHGPFVAYLMVGEQVEGLHFAMKQLGLAVEAVQRHAERAR